MGLTYPEKQDKAVSPKGEALWAFLTEPNRKWKPENGEYSVTLIMTPGKETAALITRLEAIRDEYYEVVVNEMTPAKIKKLSKGKRTEVDKREVFSDNLDAADEETGKIEFKFSSAASGVSKKTGKVWEFSPRLYDSGAREITGKLNIGNGSILQINYTPTAYFIAADCSVGCKMYVNDVMVHKLVEYGGDPGFKASDDDEGFRYEDGTEANAAPGFTPEGNAGKNVDF